MPRKIQKKSTEIINAWNYDTNFSVEPVFVLNDITTEKSWAHPDLKKSLEKMLKTVKISNIIIPKIIKNVKPPFTNRKLVAGLVKYSSSQNCQLLVINSSTDKNVLARMIFGSFAETLILSSTLPILLINSQSKKILKIKTILFATDFSSESKVVYKKVLDKAHSLGAKIILFHQTELGIMPTHKRQMGKFEDSQLVIGWKSLANKKGVAVKVVIKSGAKNKADSIVDYSKKVKVDLIALVSRSGPVSTLLLGSTTRQLARMSNLPIWIMHPKKSPKKR